VGFVRHDDRGDADGAEPALPAGGASQAIRLQMGAGAGAARSPGYLYIAWPRMAGNGAHPPATGGDGDGVPAVSWSVAPVYARPANRLARTLGRLRRRNGEAVDEREILFAAQTDFAGARRGFAADALCAHPGNGQGERTGVAAGAGGDGKPNCRPAVLGATSAILGPVAIAFGGSAGD